MRELTIVWDVGFLGGGGGVVKADHQHTVIALVKNNGKAHNIVGDPPKETGISGEQGAVNVAAVSVHILYDDLVGSAGEKTAGRGGRSCCFAADTPQVAVDRGFGDVQFPWRPVRWSPWSGIRPALPESGVSPACRRYAWSRRGYHSRGWWSGSDCWTAPGWIIQVLNHPGFRYRRSSPPLAEEKRNGAGWKDAPRAPEYLPHRGSRRSVPPDDPFP